MAQKLHSLVEFWIDVGGTFTDCMGIQACGQIVTCKLLSSATIKGQLDKTHQGRDLSTNHLNVDRESFFRGYQFNLLDEQGHLCHQSPITASSRNGHDLSLKEKIPDQHLHLKNFSIQSPEVAPVFAIRKLMNLTLNENPGKINIKLGTTRGTNALLERKGARVGVIVTRGFQDFLDISRQNRPDLFAVEIKKTDALTKNVFEINERIDASGNILISPDDEEIIQRLDQLKALGAESLAICLLNAYTNPVHENRVAHLAKASGFKYISTSSNISPTVKFVDRGETTTVNAYLSPVIQSYLQEITNSFPDCDLKLMSSAGSLLPHRNFLGKDSILSGPAAGAIGLGGLSKALGIQRSIGFDMGGTSTDVCRFNDQVDVSYESEKAGLHLVTPMVDIHTVAAGGGSICRYDGQRLIVGPESAGAHPGPACYGNGGPLTITDINFFKGRIDPSFFPFSLNLTRVQQLLTQMSHDIQEKEGLNMNIQELADGFTRIANQKMASAIREVTLTKGCNPDDHTLICFGGAGPQHACGVASELGISKIILHRYAGILSAWGMQHAVTRHYSNKSYFTILSPSVINELERAFRELEKELDFKFQKDDIAPNQRAKINRLLDLRFQGEDFSITVPYDTPANSIKKFINEHELRYGYTHKNRSVETTILRVNQETKPNGGIVKKEVSSDTLPPQKTNNKNLRTRQSDTISYYHREQLSPDIKVSGPALIHDSFSTCVVEPGWEAHLIDEDVLSLERCKSITLPLSHFKQRNPVELSLFHHHLTHIASQMGHVLQKTSISINIKERCDFSCAILDHHGHLVVNAPHIPVHLGAMSDTIQSLLAQKKQLSPGDAFLCNHPFHGGTHLPDLTVITPVFNDHRELIFFTASRAHHAELGGRFPGSFYPFATNLEEEGIVFSHLKIAENGQFQNDIVLQALSSGRYPSRNPETNISDLKSALVANHHGAELLRVFIQLKGWEYVSSYMKHLTKSSSEKTVQWIKSLQKTSYQFTDQMDDGTEIRLGVEVKDEKITFNFKGSSPPHQESLNSSIAVVKSALIYCLRLMIAEDIPLNDGTLIPVNLKVPHSFLNPGYHEQPEQCSAVVGGNVEISQRIVDVIFGAFQFQAASQGTMNNISFGNANFSYYETIGGGSGAGPTSHGASGVHVHMTNTKITDPEILEKNFPLRLIQFSIRKDSGGEGLYRGGDGLVREIEFLEDVDLSILTERRKRPPYGLHGGKPGKCGVNLLIRKNKKESNLLSSNAQLKICKGDRLKIMTPGGGAFGKA